MDDKDRTETTNPIEYQWETAGPQGGRYYLMPIKGKHSDRDLQEAKSWLSVSFDVVKTYIEWQPEEK